MLKKLNKDVTRFIKWYSSLEIYYQFLPLLLLYMTLTFINAPKQFAGDQTRYITFAKNLINGFYSPPPPEINLWNGPGYPAVIAPFLFLKLPILGLRVLNSILLYLSIIISFKTFCIYSTRKSSLIFSILLGLYFPIYIMLPLILPEVLTWFLICLLCNTFIKNYTNPNNSWKNILITSICIAYIAMTKVIFGYVIIFMLFFSILYFIFQRTNSSARISTLIFLVSFILCTPYLLYTYSFTGKVFYWSNASGESLYWMSSPYADELGDWKFHTTAIQNKSKKEKIKHGELFNEINSLTPVKRNQALNKIAIQNIINYPQKYFKNWVANIGRILFSYPFTNTYQSISTYFTIIPNMFIVVTILLLFFPILRSIKTIPIEIGILFLFFITYLFGSSLVSGYRRMFFVTVPFWALLISYAFNNIIQVKLK